MSSAPGAAATSGPAGSGSDMYAVGNVVFMGLQLREGAQEVSKGVGAALAKITGAGEAAGQPPTVDLTYTYESNSLRVEKTARVARSLLFIKPPTEETLRATITVLETCPNAAPLEWLPFR